MQRRVHDVDTHFAKALAPFKLTPKTPNAQQYQANAHIMLYIRLVGPSLTAIRSTCAW
jgi:hypothetical protein